MQLGRAFAMPDQAQRNGYFDDVLRRVRDAGRQRCCAGHTAPFAGNRSRGVAAEGQVYARGRYPQAFIRVVSEGYFRAMGIELKNGRDFEPSDTLDSAPVVIVNETLARTLWPGQSALGKVIAQGGGTRRRVIGVVGHVRHVALEAGFTNEMYLPMRQADDYRAVNLVVRSALPSGQIASAVSSSLSAIEPKLAKREWRTLQEFIEQAVSPRRFLVLLVTVFGGLALVLAAMGIYAVVSYSVQRRQKEIGVKLALGAPIRKIHLEIVGQTLGVVSVGLLAGLAVYWPVRTSLYGLLFGVQATDALTLGSVLLALTVTAVGAFAGYVPARRATALDPLASLRVE